MRIVVDLQPLQTVSRDRGIGRYSLGLVRAMIAAGGSHEWLMVLNHAFPEAMDGIRQSFAGLLPRENILTFEIPAPVAAIDPANGWRRRTAELVRENFLHQLRPDWVHVASLFEGLEDDAVTSIGALTGMSTAVTLYDLIPYLHRERYLSNPSIETWYMGKVADLKRADLMLAISGHSRREVIDALGLGEDRVVNVSTDADACFRMVEVAQRTRDRLRDSYGIMRDFVMYTGGIEHRKNIERLVEAFARLPGEVRFAHQLVLVCAVGKEDRRRLLEFAWSFGLSGDEFVLTGFVGEEELVALYNLCRLFIFPSLHEGFGLPVLEAMRCGAAVIGSDRTGVPEVLGLDAALFNPFSVESIANKLLQALTDDQFRRGLREHARTQATKFSWRESARRALDALESSHRDRQQFSVPQVSVSTRKRRLAYVSPLPPEQSGISAYSAELLPELVPYYDIDLVTDLQGPHDQWPNLRVCSVSEFERCGREYDRILYHFGNSAFHSHMFGLLMKHPGTVVLHDFFLSGILHYLEAHTAGSAIFREALYRSHGYPALRHWRLKGPADTAWTYPASLEVLRAAQGVIVHSEYSVRLAEHFFGLERQERLAIIPSLRRPGEPVYRTSARQQLGLPPDAFVVCSFGLLAATKVNDLLLSAWLTSGLRSPANSYLIFVGRGYGDDWEWSLRREIEKSGLGNRVRITGYAGPQTYESYLSAADVAVQLRARTRGETSRTVLDCLAHGLPTVVNDHGSMAELPPDVVLKIPDSFTLADLAKAMERLRREPSLREALGSASVRYVRTELDPEHIGRLYWQTIESFAKDHPTASHLRLLSALASFQEGVHPVGQDLLRTADAVAENRVPEGHPKLLLDISGVVRPSADGGVHQVVLSILNEFTVAGAVSCRVEPVYRSDGLYRYARRFMEDLIGIGPPGLEDAPVDVGAKDIFLGFNLDYEIDEGARSWLRHQSRRGAKVYFVVCDWPDSVAPVVSEKLGSWLRAVTQLVDGLVCLSRPAALDLGQWLQENPVQRHRPLFLGYCHPGITIGQELQQVLFGSRWFATWEPGSMDTLLVNESPAGEGSDEVPETAKIGPSRSAPEPGASLGPAKTPDSWAFRRPARQRWISSSKTERRKL